MSETPSSKISALPAVVAANLLETDYQPIVAGGITSRATIADLRAKFGLTVPAGRLSTPAQYVANNALFNVLDYLSPTRNPGTTDDTAGFQACLDASRFGVYGRVHIPNGQYRINSALLVQDGSTLIGESMLGVIIDAYQATGCVMRTVGTVNISGSNNCRFQDFTLRINTGTATDGIGLFYGGANIVDRVKILGAGTGKPRNCVVIDQQVRGNIRNCEFDGFTVSGVRGPWTGEYTTYGTTTGAFVTAFVISSSQFNSAEAGCIGVAIDGGENVVVDESNNFNGLAKAVRFSKVDNYVIDANYFERTAAGTTPAIHLAILSMGGAASGAAGPGSINRNHFEWVLQSPNGTHYGTIELDGHVGALSINENHGVSGFAHFVLVKANSDLIRYGDNYWQSETAAPTDAGWATDVFVAVGVTCKVKRMNKSVAEYSSDVQKFSFGGKSLWFIAAGVPSTAGLTFEAGDTLFGTAGGPPVRCSVKGTVGAAGATNMDTVNGSNIIRTTGAGGSNGNIERGTYINITGVTGTKKVLSEYTDGSDRIIELDSNCDATVNNTPVAFQAPTFEPLDGGGISPAQIVANQNDYNPSGLISARSLFINSDAARNITGVLAPDLPGKRITITNVGNFTITLKQNDVGSIAANRFLLKGGVDAALASDSGITLVYGNNAWREVVR